MAGEIPSLEHGRCCMCPHPADLAHVLKDIPALPFETAPWMDFRCGHQVHTNCFILQRGLTNQDPEYTSCPVCSQLLLTTEQLEVFAQHERDRHTREGPDVRKLWAENEEFREEVRELAKTSRGIGSLERTYHKELSELKKQFNEAVRLPLETIKQQKKIYMARAKTLASRRPYSLALGRYNRKYTRVAGTYDLSLWELERVRRIPRAPKFRSGYYRWRRSMNMFYFFRVRV